MNTNGLRAAIGMEKIVVSLMFSKNALIGPLVAMLKSSVSGVPPRLKILHQRTPKNAAQPTVTNTAP